MSGRRAKARPAALEALFADDEHVAVEATWGVYQQMIAAYRDPDKAKSKTLMQR